MSTMCAFIYRTSSLTALSSDSSFCIASVILDKEDYWYLNIANTVALSQISFILPSAQLYMFLCFAIFSLERNLDEVELRTARLCLDCASKIALILSVIELRILMAK